MNHPVCDRPIHLWPAVYRGGRRSEPWFWLDADTMRAARKLYHAARIAEGQLSRLDARSQVILLLGARIIR